MRKYNIPIFVPHRGCPFDCVFCNQNRITGSTDEVTPEFVTNTINEYVETLPKTNRNIEVAFFGGSFTGIPMEEQNSLMDCALPYIKNNIIDGIRLSTRPDYISREILDNLSSHGVTTIELGVQSMVDSVLKSSNRGHSAQQVENAVSLIKEYDFSLGLQMMTGLPGDTDEYSLLTAQRIIDLKPDFVRIYPTLTIKDTYLEKLYLRGEYVPQTLDGAVLLSKKLLLMFENAGIDVIRIGLQPTEDISTDASVVAGPFHSSFGELVESSIYYDVIKEKLDSIPTKVNYVKVFVNPYEVSKAVGNKRSNIIKLKNELKINVRIEGDKNLKKREVRVFAVKET